jgi:hypothetical protein
LIREATSSPLVPEKVEYALDLRFEFVPPRLLVVALQMFQAKPFLEEGSSKWCLVFDGAMVRGIGGDPR